MGVGGRRRQTVEVRNWVREEVVVVTDLCLPRLSNRCPDETSSRVSQTQAIHLTHWHSAVCSHFSYQQFRTFRKVAKPSHLRRATTITHPLPPTFHLHRQQRRGGSCQASDPTKPCTTYTTRFNDFYINEASPKLQMDGGSRVGCERGGGNVVVVVVVERLIRKGWRINRGIERLQNGG